MDVIKVPNESEVKTEIKNIDEYKIVDLQDELNLWETEQIPHALKRLTEGQILEEFILEEIEFWGIDKCIMAELQDEQEIERCIDRETVRPAEMPVRIACEQEECIEEEICDMSLPKLYRAEESVHKDEIKLEIPKINAVEISELPREVKLEMPIEQSQSKLVQDVNLVSDIPTHFMQYMKFLYPMRLLTCLGQKGKFQYQVEIFQVNQYQGYTLDGVRF